MARKSDMIGTILCVGVAGNFNGILNHSQEHITNVFFFRLTEELVSISSHFGNPFL